MPTVAEPCSREKIGGRKGGKGETWHMAASNQQRRDWDNTSSLGTKIKGRE